MKNNTKRLSSYACLAAFALLLILTLLFTTLGFTEGEIDSENGFKWLTFDTSFMEDSDTWEYGQIPLGIISIAQLIIGLFALGVVVKGYVNGKPASQIKLFGMGFTSLVLYAIEGFSILSLFGDEIGELFSKYLTTYAYVPLIIGIVLAVAYALIQAYMPDSDREETAHVPATPKPATPKPATPKPATPKPATPKPVTPKPVTPKPVTPKSSVSKPVAPVKEVLRFDIVITGVDPSRKMDVIRAVRAVTGLSFGGNLPQTIKSTVSEEYAEECKAILNASGAAVVIKTFGDLAEKSDGKGMVGIASQTTKNEASEEVFVARQDVRNTTTASVTASPKTSPTATPAAPAHETSSFDVILTGINPARKIDVIRVVREITGFGFKDSKDIVEALPKTIKEDISKADAEKYKAALAEVGATVALTPVKEMFRANDTARFSVILTGINPARKIDVIRVVREITDFSLRGKA